MWFNNEILQASSIRSVVQLGKALDSESKGWWKAWFQFSVGACLVEEADLQDSR